MRERVSTLKLVYLLQHNFQFWGCFLHMRGEYGQAVPEVVSEEHQNEQNEGHSESLHRDNSTHLGLKRHQLMTAHTLVRVYVLHGCSQSIADQVYFFPIRILGQLGSAGNWWRVHGLRNIFFPKNKLLKGH